MTALYDVLKANVNGATKLALIADFDRVLSLSLMEKAEEKRNAPEESPADGADAELVAWIEAMIEERAAAKREKNYARADEIRGELTAKGVTLKDTKEGTTYTIG